MIKIVADSGCDLSEDMKNKKGIDVTIIPLSLELGEKKYVDDGTMDIPSFMVDMSKSSIAPKTAAPSPELYLEAFKGPESVFCITVTSALSGSYNSACLAKKIYFDEIGEKFIHVIDTRAASTSLVLVALKINEFKEKNIPDFEIVEKITKFAKELSFYFIMEKFDNLVKTGRVNPTIAKIANFLSIKPICHGNPEGEIEMLAKAKGFEKASHKLIDIIKNSNKDFENRVLAISHVQCLERALSFKEEIIKKIKFKDIVISEAGGLTSTYGNENSLFVSI